MAWPLVEQLYFAAPLLHKNIRYKSFATTNNLFLLSFKSFNHWVVLNSDVYMTTYGNQLPVMCSNRCLRRNVKREGEFKNIVFIHYFLRFWRIFLGFVINLRIQVKQINGAWLKKFKIIRIHKKIKMDSFFMQYLILS